MLKILEKRRTKYLAEHNYGQMYKADKPLAEYSRKVTLQIPLIGDLEGAQNIRTIPSQPVSNFALGKCQPVRWDYDLGLTLASL
tara:strand:+ start:1676 stop:1927 length:252 start_codon:yes stop_codon:yes gene_type:complete